MPDGRIYVHTGLLSQVENEAQLATVLAREMAHVTSRHALGVLRGAAEARVLLPALAVTIGAAAALHSRGASGDPVGTAAIGSVASAILSVGAEIAWIASMKGYGEVFERRADEDGLARLAKAGYDPREALRTFERLTGRSDGEPLEMFVLGNRHNLHQRVDTTRRMLATRVDTIAALPSTTDVGDFRLRMQTVVRENALLDIRTGRFDLALRQLIRVGVFDDRDAVNNFYYGELSRLRAQRTDAAAEKRRLEERALLAYEHALLLDPAYADPLRGLGLLYFQQGDYARARAAFARYVELKRDVSDARRIEDYMAALSRE